MNKNTVRYFLFWGGGGVQFQNRVLIQVRTLLALRGATEPASAKSQEKRTKNLTDSGDTPVVSSPSPLVCVPVFYYIFIFLYDCVTTHTKRAQVVYEKRTHSEKCNTKKRIVHENTKPPN